MEKHPTPLKSIRLKCLDCCCGSEAEVRDCAAKNCPLYFYRMGHNPNRTGTGNKKAIPPQVQ